MLTCCAPFVNIQFLGSSLTFMMVGTCCSLCIAAAPIFVYCSSPYYTFTHGSVKHET